ncbi:immunoglobulin-like domain-containing protein [Paenibacillaceae bacterium WGS1546]|uniref:immunoglobulin-like domain-containing protein n=1 Tax=Cohnella sp. WGS1546 TaxID=3366810 RepID=UPI00372D634A
MLLLLISVAAAAPPSANAASPVKAIALSGGGDQALALKSDGTVVGWGWNLGTGIYVNTQVVQANLAQVTAVSAGEHHWIALKSDGTVVGGGVGDNGRINTSAYSGVDAISAGAHYSLMLIDGKVHGVGQNYHQELNIPAGLSNVTAIAAGYYHALALKSDGTVTAWGNGYWGDTPDVSTVPAELTGETVVAIAAGDDHSLALKEDGKVVAWGRNTKGQSTVPAGLTDVVDIDAGFEFSLALKSDGKVVAWGDMIVPEGLTDVVDIDAGYSHAMALRDDGSVVVWMNGVTGLITTVPGSGDLSGLALQEGPLDKPFQASDTDYTFYNSDPDRESVHLTATLADADNAALYINDELQTSGSEVEVDLTGDVTEISIRVEPYLLPGKTYTVTVADDMTPPNVHFGANGGAEPAKNAVTTVTVSDAASGLDEDTLEYAWSEDASTPDEGWTNFTNGATVEKTSGDGNWYLHIRARDLAGNVADAVSNAFVLDNTAPELTLIGSNPMNIPQGGTYTEPGATATDAIDGAVPTSSIAISGAVDTAHLGNYTVQYTAADRAGNTATVTRDVYVYDGDEPAIDLIGPNPMTVEANSPFADPGATAYDVQDGDLTASIQVTGAVDPSTLGTYTLSYDVSDTAGNAAATVTRTVYVQDTQPPVLTLLGDPAMSVPVGAAFADPGAQATDAYYGDISDRIVVTGTVDTSQAGEHTLRYSVEDPSGNAASVIRNVYVYDGDEPAIYLKGSNPMTVEANSPFVDPGATAQDVQDGDLSASIIVTGTVDPSTLGTYTLTYNVSDAAGNAAATVTRTVHVQDTQPPVLTLLGESEISVSVGAAFADPGAQATDAYYGDVSDRIVVTGTVDTSQAGEYTIRYNVTDPSGNAAAEATRTVTVAASGGSNGSDGSGNTGNAGTNEPPDNDEHAAIRQVSVTINGVVKWVDASYESSGGQRITRIFPTAEQLSEALATEPGGIRIEAQDIGDSVQMDIPAAPLLHALALRPDAQLEWRVNGNGLHIPLHVLQGVPKEAAVTFGIAAAAGSVSDAGNGAIARAGGEPLLPHPVVYTLQVKHGDSIDWTPTNALLTAHLPEPANPYQATAVRIDENGRIRFAPSIFSNNGLVTIRSPYDGAYAVIETDHSFADVNGHWAQEDIVLMANKLLVEGRGQDQFVPDDQISRAEFAAMLVRALGLDDEPDGSSPFRDVAPGAWYAGAVRAAQQHRLIEGLEDGTFRPEAPVTREQMAVMIVRAMEYAGHAPDANGAMARTFADEAEIAPWADDAVGRLTGASIIRGLTETKFGPREYASRAQSAVLLKRMLQAMQFINP